MTTYEKKRKAAIIAAAYYIEQEKENAKMANQSVRTHSWSRTGKEIAMNKRYVIQCRGRMLRSA